MGLARIASAAIGLLFVYAAVIQYNDPDPAIWIAFYLGAAAICAAAALDRIRWPVAATFSFGAMIWAGVLAFRVVGRQPLFEEEGREMLGLVIAGVWTGLIALEWRRKGVS